MNKISENLIVLALDNSRLSKDLLSTLTQADKNRTYLLVEDKDFYKELNSSNESRNFKEIVLLANNNQRALEKTLLKIEKTKVNRLALFLMHLEKINSSFASSESVEFLLENGLNLNLSLGEYFKESIKENRGKILLPLYYYKNEILLSNGLYSALFTAVERYYQSFNKSLMPSQAHVDFIYVKAPAEYTETKYRAILTMLYRDLYTN